MTADQMPDEIYIPEIGDDDYSQKIYYQTKGMGVEYIRSDLATPPKSQGAVWGNVVELCHAITLARWIISVWCKDAPKENLSDWDIKWEAANKAVVAIQEATRQHHTPAQAQGESVTVEELVNPIGTAYRTAGNLDAKDWTHVFVSTLQALGYTIIKRTE